MSRLVLRKDTVDYEFRVSSGDFIAGSIARPLIPETVRLILLSMSVFMRTDVVIIAIVAVLSGRLVAQEQKPVPKDSMRVSIPGCTKGYVFTAGRPTLDEPGSVSVPEGMHFRMNGPKKLIAEIKAQEGSMIEITGVTKRGQYKPDGVAIGGGVRVGPGPGVTGGSPLGSPVGSQIGIDVEGWRLIEGRCPSR
jgi:hypothetical protein